MQACRQHRDARKKRTCVVQKELLGVEYKLDAVPSRVGVDTRTGVHYGTVQPTKTQAAPQAQHNGPTPRYKYRPLSSVHGGAEGQRSRGACSDGVPCKDAVQLGLPAETQERPPAGTSAVTLRQAWVPGTVLQRQWCTGRARPGAGSHPVRFSAEKPCDLKTQCCGGMPSVGTAQWCIARSSAQTLGESTAQCNSDI